MNGTKNLIRFGFDSFSLDGLPAIQSINNIQTHLRKPLIDLVDRLGIILETPIASAKEFTFDRNPVAYEDEANWGIMGFALIWPAVFIMMIFPSKNRSNKVLAFAAMLFLLLQAYSGPYDPYRGRYFTNCAIFAVPVMGNLFQTKFKVVRLYIYLVAILGCICALSAVVFRTRGALITLEISDLRTKSIFSMDRLTQLTINNPGMTTPLIEFERIVPTNASVAVFLKPDSYEYPLFGKGLTRKIIPINSFKEGIKPIPLEAGYLLYSIKGYPCPSPEDILLGRDLYLRKLTEFNRACP